MSIISILIFFSNLISFCLSQQFGPYNQFGQPGYVPSPNSDGRYFNNFNYEPRQISVNTPKGRVMGQLVYLFDSPGIDDEVGQPSIPYPRLNVTVFWGIPYAEPPIGELRFRPPEQKHAWAATLNCTQIPPVCPQPGNSLPPATYISENCLYLNVFTPNITVNDRILYPVMVYIHGGGFQSGAGHLFPPHILAASQGVVVVTFNYRLGSLGFLSTGDEVSPGNYGLLDQLMAITWVRDSIAAFKGNPNDITIFGHEAGAVSAGLLSLSPKSKDLFKAVIAQSGAEVAQWGVVENPETSWNTSKRFGDRIGCNTQSSRKLLSCLISRTAMELASTIVEPEIGLYPFTPVVDVNYWHRQIYLSPKNTFLPKRPEWLIEDGVYTKMPYLCGFMRDDGTKIILQDSSLGLKYYEMTRDEFDGKIYEYIKKWNLTISRKEIFPAIRFMYTYWPDPTNKTWIRQEFINMLSDAYFKSPCDAALKYRSKHTPVNTLYMYLFNYTLESFNKPVWNVVPHESELPLVFGIPFLDKKYLTTQNFQTITWTRSDRNMSEMLMKMWTNFAKSGNPTPVRVYNATWLPLSQGSLNYLTFNSSNTTWYYQNYEQTQMEFWRYYMPIVADFGVVTPISYWLDEYDKPYYVALWSIVSVASIFLIIIITLCCFIVRRRNRDDDYDEKDTYSME